MLALVKVRPEPDAVELREIDTPDPGPEEVLVKVEAAGICGTDISVIAWRPNLAARAGGALPLVLGHEFAGTVVRGGTRTTLSVGTAVTGNPQLYCGICRWCLAGRTSICANRPMLGINHPGTFAEYLVIREANVYPLPDGVSPIVGSLCDTIAGAVHALERVIPPRDEPALVVGCGPLGLMVGLVLKASGLAQVFISGTDGDDDRLGLAESLGLLPLHANAMGDAITTATDGRGVGSAFEVAGSTSAVSQAIQAVRRGGRVGLMGLGPDASAIYTGTLVTREIDLVPICAYYPSSWDGALELLKTGSLDLDRLITHRVPFYEYLVAFDLMRSREGVKIVLEPSRPRGQITIDRDFVSRNASTPS